MIHDFQKSLMKSHEAEDFPLWEECYRQFFPFMASMTNHRGNGEHQRAGIDRSITLDNAKQILIDEKARYPHSETGKIYEDIALEYLSDSYRGKPGWICKPLRCDYIAYAILGLGKCYLLPVIQLQQAWIEYGEIWKGRYFNVKAENFGYITMSVAVPQSVLYAAIGSFLRCEFKKIEFNNSKKS